MQRSRDGIFLAAMPTTAFAGFALLTVRNGIVTGCGAYAPGLAPIAVVLSDDTADDARRIRARLAEAPAQEKTG